MKKIALLTCLMLVLSACDGDKNNEPEKTVPENTAAEVQPLNPSQTALWQGMGGEPETFAERFAALNEVQKYYFCAAFAVGAMSESKPATASAMVNYFIGLGKAQYNLGIDDTTYPAFDFGKHIFSYELIVNKIPADGTCEKIVLDAMEFAKNKNYSDEYIADLGKPEVEKIVKLLKTSSLSQSEQ